MVGAYQSWQHRTARSQRVAVRANGILRLIVDFPYRLLAPFARLLPKGCIVRIQIVESAAYYVSHILQGLSVSALVVLIHHHLGVEHISHGLCHAAKLALVCLHRQQVLVEYILQVGYYVFVNLVGLQLRSRVWHCLKIFGEERNVAPELPKVIIIVGSQHACLCRSLVDKVLAQLVARVVDVAQHVVGALDA